MRDVYEKEEKVDLEHWLFTLKREKGNKNPKPQTNNFYRL